MTKHLRFEEEENFGMWTKNFRYEMTKSSICSVACTYHTKKDEMCVVDVDDGGGYDCESDVE